MKQALLASILFVTAMPVAGRDLAVLEPADAIAWSNQAPGGVRARFAMTVRGVGKDATATYLNSEADYSAPTNVTFQLTPGAVRRVTKDKGGRLEAMLGTRVVVDGILDRVPVYRTKDGRPQAFLRMQYVVKLRRAAQIVSVGP